MSILHKPTPTPWHYQQDECDELNIYRSTNNTGVVIATLYSDPMDEETHANAALIITAVNHHAELVTRLENIVKAANSMLEEVGDNALELARDEAEETLKKFKP